MTAPATDTQDRQRATPLRGWPQRLTHSATLLAGWALFFWGWHEVLGRPWESRALWWLIAGSLVVLPAFTVAWILHNVGINRRKGPRTGVRKVDEAYLRDWNGREVAADWNALSRAYLVVIDVEDERKVFRVAAADPLPSVPELAPRRRAVDRAPDDRPTEIADWSAA